MAKSAAGPLRRSSAGRDNDVFVFFEQLKTRPKGGRNHGKTCLYEGVFFLRLRDEFQDALVLKHRDEDKTCF